MPDLQYTEYSNAETTLRTSAAYNSDAYPMIADTLFDRTSEWQQWALRSVQCTVLTTKQRKGSLFSWTPQLVSPRDMPRVLTIHHAACDKWIQCVPQHAQISSPLSLVAWSSTSVRQSGCTESEITVLWVKPGAILARWKAQNIRSRVEHFSPLQRLLLASLWP